uniref:Titin n=1 Tax=Cynoglossus semilaevis TaxID=244447 RepID=A0A3P8WYP0_CYNSE
MQPKGEDRWSVCSEVKALEATIGGLATGEEYSFRVIAVNDKGKSDPKPLAAPVVVKDITVIPTVSLVYHTYSIKAGDDLKIDVPFRSRPDPDVCWKKNGQVLKQTTRVNVLSSKTSSKITIKDATKDDVGKYEITLTNSIGTTTAEVSVIVLDKPGPPSNIKVDEVKGEALESDPARATDPYTIPAAPTNVQVTAVTSEAMTICWERPVSDGGSSISGYVIEKREKTGLRWCRVNKKPVYDLRVKYRVFAENSAGLSAPSIPCPLTKAEDPQFLPSPPAKPKIIDSTKTTVTLSWNKPLFDGGATVTGYRIEYRIASDDEWFVGVQNTKNTEFTVVGLTPGSEYVFVVRSINKIGLSEWSNYSILPIILNAYIKIPSKCFNNELITCLFLYHSSSQ